MIPEVLLIQAANDKEGSTYMAPEEE